MDDHGFIELLLVLAGLVVGAYGAYRVNARLVGIGVVLLAFAMLAVHWIGG